MYRIFLFLFQKDEDDFDWLDNLNQKLKSKNEVEDKKARVASITNKGKSGQTSVNNVGVASWCSFFFSFVCLAWSGLETGADEDWEHVENASDDDEANINDSDDENVEEERNYDQKQIQE